MEWNFELVKKHPYAVGGTLFAVFLIAYLYVRSRKSSAISTGDLSLGSTQLQNYNTAASLQNAQIQAQIAQSDNATAVVNNQTAAALEAKQAETAAQLQLGLATVNASIQNTSTQYSSAVEIQKLQSDADVQKTQIQANAYETLSANQTSIQKQILTNIDKQINVKDTGHLASYLRNISPIIALETGQGGAAVGLAASEANVEMSSSPSAIISSFGKIASGASGLSF